MQDMLVPNFYNVNCMEYMKSMEDNSVDFTLTDVPWDFHERGSKDSIRNLDFGAANDATFNLTEFLNQVSRITRNTCLIFCGWDQFSQIITHFLDLNKGTVRPLVWEKTNPLPLNATLNYLSAIELAVWWRAPNATFNAKFKSNVLRYAVQSSDKIKNHPTKKNVEMFKDFVLDNTNPGDLVFDPCCGSGTTIEACLQTNRRYIACELDPTFYETTSKYLYQNYSMLLAMS